MHLEVHLLIIILNIDLKNKQCLFFLCYNYNGEDMELIRADYVERIYHEVPSDLDNGILYRYCFNDLKKEPFKYGLNIDYNHLWSIKSIYSYERWNGIDTRQIKYEPFYGVNEYGDYSLIGIKTIYINIGHYRIDLYSYKDNCFKNSYICNCLGETFILDKRDYEYKCNGNIYFCGMAALDNLSLFKKLLIFNEVQKNSKSAYDFIMSLDKQKLLHLKLNIV
jgi:hypothetical protein